MKNIGDILWHYFWKHGIFMAVADMVPLLYTSFMITYKFNTHAVPTDPPDWPSLYNPANS